MTINEGISVLVTMNTDISDGNNKETVRFTTDGRLFKKNNNVYLQFKEDNKETGEVNQIVKMEDNDTVTVLRQGAVSMKQLFIVDEKTEGVYRSPFGTMLMNTSTKDIHIEINEQEAVGKVQLSYQLHMQHEFAGNYNVTINFRRNQ